MKWINGYKTERVKTIDLEVGDLIIIPMCSVNTSRVWEVTDNNSSGVSVSGAELANRPYSTYNRHDQKIFVDKIIKKGE